MTKLVQDKVRVKMDRLIERSKYLQWISIKFHWISVKNLALSAINPAKLELDENQLQIFKKKQSNLLLFLLSPFLGGLLLIFVFPAFIHRGFPVLTVVLGIGLPKLVTHQHSEFSKHCTAA